MSGAPDGAVSRPAAQPDADLACDFTIAKRGAEIRDELARGIVPPIRQLPDGVEVTFAPDSWDAVLQYIEMESRCCPFLDLAARRTDRAVLLSVTGRTSAREFISAIFAGN